MILPIVAYNHPVLKKKAVEIDEDYPNLKELLQNMFDTMDKARGVGLAAPQINLSIRVMVIDARAYCEEDSLAKDFRKVFINPLIIEEEGIPKGEVEGCLSIPGINEEVLRKPTIVIEYQDENFEWREETYSGILARIIQHEMDHLDGKTFIDRLNPLTKIMLKRRLENISKGNTEVAYKMTFPKK